MLVGGDGADLLTGGTGGDSFVLAAGSSSVDAPDTITDFRGGFDRLVIRSGSAASVGGGLSIFRTADMADGQRAAQNRTPIASIQRPTEKRRSASVLPRQERTFAPLYANVGCATDIDCPVLDALDVRNYSHCEL